MKTESTPEAGSDAENGVHQLSITPSTEVGQTINAGDPDSAVLRVVNHRRLSSRQVQLASIAGAVGADLFVPIGKGVLSSPTSLLLAFIFWSSVIFCIAQCQLEIVSQYPSDGSFLRLAGRMVDPAFGVAASWNVFS